jgi:hypothetical protein
MMKRMIPIRKVTRRPMMRLVILESRFWAASLSLASAERAAWRLIGVRGTIRADFVLGQRF